MFLNYPFDLLPASEQSRLEASSESVFFSPGDLIFSQDAPVSECLYLVLTGGVRFIDGLSRRACADGPLGSLCGLQSVLTQQPQSCDVIAALPTQCAKLSAPFFLQICEQYPNFRAVFPTEWEPLPEPPDAGGWEGGPACGPFAFLQQWLMERSWTSILDAGTGESSLRWILNLPQTRWTAITGSTSWETTLHSLFAPHFRPQDHLMVGNWCHEELLQGERFDVVLADYLLGAIERFAPYFQEQLWRRLHRHVGQWLLIVGLEPPLLQTPTTPGGRLIQRITRLRDACLLLAGQTNFREYPLPWVQQTLQQSGFRIEAWRTFPNKLGLCYIHTLLDECLRILPSLHTPQLSNGFAHHIADLRREACELSESHWGIRFGADYAVIASPV